MRWCCLVMLAAAGCVDFNGTRGADGCPKADLATYACPDGRCVPDLDQCQCNENQRYCEDAFVCVGLSESCPRDTATAG